MLQRHGSPAHAPLPGSPFSLTRKFPHGPSPRSHGRRSPLTELQPHHPAQLPVLRTPLRCLLHALPRRVGRSRDPPVPPPPDRSQTSLLRGLSANLRRPQVPVHRHVESSLGSRTHSVSQTPAPALARGAESRGVAGVVPGSSASEVPGAVYDLLRRW